MTTPPPAVSVIIPARDAEATLPQALQSLQAQAMPDWDAVIVDDGSSDATAAIASNHAGRDPRFHLLRTRAGGAAAARNAGLAVARGHALLFLDADDWIAPDHLGRLAGLRATTGATAAYGAWRRVMPDGATGPARFSPDIAAAPSRTFAERCDTAIHAVLVDRKAVMATGGFDTSLQTCEDWALWQDLAFAGARFAGTPEPLAFYRTRAGSLTHRRRRMLRDGLAVQRRGHARLEATATTPVQCGAYFAAWCAAAETAGGGDGVALMDEVPVDIRFDVEVTTLASTLLDALAVGAAIVPADLAAAWPRFAHGLAALLAWIEARADHAGLARRLTYSLETGALRAADLPAPVSLGLTMGARVDLRRPMEIAPAPGVDRALLRFCDGPQVVRAAEVPLLGPLDARDLTELAMQEVGLRRVAASAAVWRRPAACLRGARHAARPLARAAAGLLLPRRYPARPGGTRGILKAALRRAVIDSAGPRATMSHRTRLAGIVADARAEAAGLETTQAAATHSPPSAGCDCANGRCRREYWERVFEQPDPWRYDSGYETEKYRHTLDLLPDAPIARALELACAEGHFTRLLAPRVGHLAATDISTRALARAAARCEALDNIAFAPLDLEADALPSGLGLIVCSEVLYYLPDEAALRSLALRIRDALEPGGCFLTAHAFVLADEMGRTAFDWGHAFGAATIARVFAGTPGLVHERSRQTELYRVDRFRRDDAQGAPPVIEMVPMQAQLSARVARWIVWGGAQARRDDVRRDETTRHVPVLMYHRISETGPDGLARFRVSPPRFEAQLRLLRQRGYHPVSSAELRWFMAARHPVPGRPVLITFDDGTSDFADIAWPLLQANGFSAEVFVPTDAVGGDAAWDAAYGPPAPLMGWPAIIALARQGVLFGSHLAQHVDGLTLSTAELARQLARSRAVLEARLGQEVRAYAAPYGALDECFARLAAECGYDVGFSTRHAIATLADPPLMVPRIEVRGDWDLDTFADALKPPP